MKKLLFSFSWTACLISLISISLIAGSNYKDTLELEQVSFLDCMFTDVNGQSREVTIPREFVEGAVKNDLAFDGSSIPGMTRITESDMVLKLNMNTLTILPWTSDDRKTARVMCDVYRDEHTPYEGDVRCFLKQALNEAREMGYDFFVGPELEFFVCKEQFGDGKKHKPCDQQRYFDSDFNPFMAGFKRNLLNALRAQNIPVEKLHHEVAPGQYEVSLRYNNALTVADQLMITKQTIRAIALIDSLSVTYMPRPFYGQNGSGMHIHFSLWDTTNNRNAFYDKDDPAHLSQTAKHFIAGILAHITELNAIFNPTINSYKRLVPGFEAPINICWGTKNRSAMIRIPRINDDQATAARAEIRSPDPLCNPYLAFAVLLKLGLHGIKNKMVPPPAVEDNLYHISDQERKARNIRALPASLEQALANLAQSNLAQSLLGNTLRTEFIKCKTQEVLKYNTFITNWELREYFEG